MDGLQVGRIVHVRSENGECRAAIVSRVFDKETGCVNLNVFPGGPEEESILPKFWTSVLPGEDVNNWHWPER